MKFTFNRKMWVSQNMGFLYVTDKFTLLVIPSMGEFRITLIDAKLSIKVDVPMSVLKGTSVELLDYIESTFQKIFDAFHSIHFKERYKIV